VELLLNSDEQDIAEGDRATVPQQGSMLRVGQMHSAKQTRHVRHALQLLFDTAVYWGAAHLGLRYRSTCKSMAQVGWAKAKRAVAAAENLDWNLWGFHTGGLSELQTRDHAIDHVIMCEVVVLLLWTSTFCVLSYAVVHRERSNCYLDPQRQSSPGAESSHARGNLWVNGFVRWPCKWV